MNSNGGVSLDGIDFRAIYNNVAILTGSPMLNQPNGRFNNLNLLPATPSDKGETRALYLTIPAMADYHFAKRWSVSAGFNAHIIMAAQVMRYNYSYSINNATYTVQAEDRSADGFTNVLVSAATQVRFQLVKQVSLDLGYSYTLTPIYDQQVANTSEQAKYKVLSLSARYWLTL
ncbi:MAG: outer membrane beta-barrel protein [Cyclobacteriaceae bacterium]|nr:outer membrane beta-barrel protein [Cyclobacteriaceae bacterium]